MTPTTSTGPATMTDPGLFQPWRDDPRPVWQVTARWTTDLAHSDDDLAYLTDTLIATGMAKTPRLTAGDGWFAATLRVKASGPEAAELIGVRVVEVAHRAARLGVLGTNVTRRVEPNGNRDIAGESVSSLSTISSRNAEPVWCLEAERLGACGRRASAPSSAPSPRSSYNRSDARWSAEHRSRSPVRCRTARRTGPLRP